MRAYHLSHTVREHMLARPATRYFRVLAADAPQALTGARVELRNLGVDPDDGEWAIARADVAAA